MVDRYDFGCLDRGYIRENGKWVKYKDYEKLKQQNEELKTLLHASSAILKNSGAERLSRRITLLLEGEGE